VKRLWIVTSTTCYPAKRENFNKVSETNEAFALIKSWTKPVYKNDVWYCFGRELIWIHLPRNLTVGEIAILGRTLGLVARFELSENPDKVKGVKLNY
jgi:hypothetical protein